MEFQAFQTSVLISVIRMKGLVWMYLHDSDILLDQAGVLELGSHAFEAGKIPLCDIEKSLNQRSNTMTDTPPLLPAIRSDKRGLVPRKCRITETKQLLFTHKFHGFSN